MNNIDQANIVNFYSHIAEKYTDIEENWSDWLSFNKACLKELIDTYCHHATRVLDCAAGVGSQALALEAMGLSVVASDICPSVLEEIRKFSSMPVVVSGWHELGDKLGDEEFDAIFCMDNAIGHSPDAKTLQQSIEQMSKLLSVSDNASLFISTRDFDAMGSPRPNGFPKNRIDSDSYHQKWDWISSNEYYSTWFIHGEKQATARMRCIFRSELYEIPAALGLKLVECKPIYTQPVYRLSRG